MIFKRSSGRKNLSAFFHLAYKLLRVVGIKSMGAHRTAIRKYLLARRMRTEKFGLFGVDARVLLKKFLSVKILRTIATIEEFMDSLVTIASVGEIEYSIAVTTLIFLLYGRM
jgi:hypothetical protein